jgi:hypothetical protein
MLYPFTDNYLDDPGVELRDKLLFQKAFERRLRGIHTPDDIPKFRAGQSAFDMVDLIEQQWPRGTFPDAYLALVAINDAQTWSLFQHAAVGVAEKSHSLMLHKSVFKGGASVLADAYMVNGTVPVAEAAFAFALGFALQMVDDLQDTTEDLANGQHTLFTVAHIRGFTTYGECGAMRLANFLHFVVRSARLSAPRCDRSLDQMMLNMTWNMVLKATARNPELFSSGFKKRWGPHGPLPSAKMAELSSMREMHRLALSGEI